MAAAVAPFGTIEPYIIQAESGGQNQLCQLPGCPGIPNPQGAPTSTAGGYFQITNSTWALVPSSIRGNYTTAIQAPFNVQQSAANYLWNTDSGSDWLGNPSAGYAGNSNIIAANAALVAGQTPSLPVSSAVTSLVADGPAATFTLPNPLGAGAGDAIPTTTGSPGTGGAGQPAAVTGATVQTPGAIATSLLSSIETWLGSIGGNLGIAFLAILLFIIAVWPVAKPVVVSAVKGASEG